MTATSSALVLFSGGQDSTTILAWALDRFDLVEAVGFAYGQRHAAELDARPRILEKLRRRQGQPAYAPFQEIAGEGGLGRDDKLRWLGPAADLAEQRTELV